MKVHRWFLIPSITLLFCFAFSFSLLADENLPAIVKRIEPSVVVITTYDREGKNLGQGSGFFISNDGDVITNWHVLQGANRAEVKTPEGKLYLINRVLAEDKEGDLIRVSVDISTSAVKPLVVTRSFPKVGEQVIVIGNPLGLERTVSDGIVSAVREIPEFGKIIQITAPVSSGSSGSPVLNMKGEVIGVATFLLVEGQNLNFAIPAERVVKLTPGKGQILAEWQAGRTKEWLTSAEGLYSCGLFFLWAEDYEKALPYFQEAVKKNPRYAEAYFQIGYCNGKLGRHKEAIEAYKKAIQINREDVVAYHNLGVAYGELGYYTEAIETFKQEIRIRPDDAQGYYSLGLTYSKLGRHTEAIEAYKQAIRVNPDYVEAHNNLGWVYDKIGHYTEAIEALKQAVRINPYLAESHFILGRVYNKLGHHNQAIEALKQAVRIKPDYVEAHVGLGLTYLILGDRGSALNEYKILKELDKDLANELFNLIYE